LKWGLAGISAKASDNAAQLRNEAFAMLIAAAICYQGAA
jgi:hypothetical protein